FAILEIFWQLFTRIGVITLSLAQSDAAAGVFATGLRLIETALLPLSFLGVAFYPRLSQLFVTEPAAFQRQSGELIWLMLLIGGGVAWGLYFVAPSLLVPVLGARFAGSEPAIRAMAGLALVQAVEVGLGRVMLCADLQVPRAAFLAIGSVLSVVLNLIFVPRLGVSGAILAASAAYVVISALYLGVLRRPVSSSVLLPVMLTLGAILVAGAGTAGLLAAAGRAVWLQAAASAAVLLMVAGGCYLYRMRARVTAAPR
ncbi:MAG TPA: polysaccharide biosynthesis C-terminal domain-containing protein, partial [Steroidobacteraceae bacterium]|nr:polysaccharide biosynthesis C-terminal domain-containing protein [Steroidobacteraceae bacterium]